MEFCRSVAFTGNDQDLCFFNRCRNLRKGILHRNSFLRFWSISELAVIIFAGEFRLCMLYKCMELQLALGVFLVFIASMQVKISHRNHCHDVSKSELRLIKLFSRDRSIDCSKKEKVCATNWTILSSDIDKLMKIIITAFELCMIIVFFYVIMCLGVALLET